MPIRRSHSEKWGYTETELQKVGIIGRIYFFRSFENVQNEFALVTWNPEKMNWVKLLDKTSLENIVPLDLRDSQSNDESNSEDSFKVWVEVGPLKDSHFSTSDKNGITYTLNAVQRKKTHIPGTPHHPHDLMSSTNETQHKGRNDKMVNSHIKKNREECDKFITGRFSVRKFKAKGTYSHYSLKMRWWLFNNFLLEVVIPSNFDNYVEKRTPVIGDKVSPKPGRIVSRGKTYNEVNNFMENSLNQYNELDERDCSRSNDSSFFKKSVPTGQSKVQNYSIKAINMSKQRMASLSSSLLKNVNRSYKSESLSSK